MRTIAFLLAGFALALPPAAAQTMDFAKTTETVTDLGHGMYAFVAHNPDPRAGIGDITVAVGRDGVIVVDSQYAQLYPMVKAKIAAITPLPIKYLINTHYHGDHAGGNAPFAKDGAVIMAHANVLKRMATARNTPKEALPAQTYSGQGTEVRIAGQRAELVHPDNPAHTDGDTIVFWPDANVITTGDLVHKPGYPNIDTDVGGNIDGMIVATDFIIAHADAKTKIVPGHGDVMDRAAVIGYRKMLKTARDRIAKAKAGGMSEDEVTKANLLADLDKVWKISGSSASESFPVNVYRGLK